MSDGNSRTLPWIFDTWARGVWGDENLEDCSSVAGAELLIHESWVDSNEVQDAILANTVHCLAFPPHPDKVPKDRRSHHCYRDDRDDLGRNSVRGGAVNSV
jgi:hypothetical protein